MWLFSGKESNPMEKTATVGIDIGGAHTKVGLFSCNRGLVRKCWIDNRDKSRNQIRREASSLILSWKKRFPDYLIKGIGIGCPGRINSQKGVVLYSNNLKRKNYPRKEIREERTGLKVRITNDANAALLGEAVYGKAKGRKTAVLLTLGTGLGSGILVDGKIREGKDGTGAEIGHRILYRNGRTCTCGRKGCAERYASATGLILDALDLKEKFPDSPIYKDLNIKTVISFASKDMAAKEALDHYLDDLKEVIININILFRPQAVLLGGGVADFASFFLPQLKKKISNDSSGFEKGHKTEIRVAKRKNNAGIYGASALWGLDI